MMYTDNIIQFFSLLRAGLWNSEVDRKEFEKSVNWNELLLMANEQTVSGIVFDGLQNLKGTKCDRATLMEWIGCAKKIENANQQLNLALAYLVYKYQEAGLNPIVLKGQAIAQYYKNPLHRLSGDIDLYFPNGYNKANDIIKSMPGAVVSEETLYHQSFCIANVCVENHYSYIHFYSKRNQRAWEEVLAMMDAENYEIQKFNGKNGRVVEVPVFSPQLNAIYIFLHI